jgi:chemotaxis protein MotA
MIKGFGILSFLLFLILCAQIGTFGPGFAVWFLSALMVISGTVSSVFFFLPAALEKGGLQHLKSFSYYQPLALVDTIHEIAEQVRKDGLLSIESIRQDIKDSWLQYALKKMVEGFDQNSILPVIRNEGIRSAELFTMLEQFKERVSSAIPLFGLAGSLSHLMFFLSKNDQSLVAASFVPFLFSVLLQVVFSMWIQSQIDFLSDRSRIYHVVLEEGIAGIQSGIHADLLKDQLVARINHV